MNKEILGKKFSNRRISKKTYPTQLLWAMTNPAIFTCTIVNKTGQMGMRTSLNACALCVFTVHVSGTTTTEKKYHA